MHCKCFAFVFPFVCSFVRSLAFLRVHGTMTAAATATTITDLSCDCIRITFNDLDGEQNRFCPFAVPSPLAVFASNYRNVDR